MEITQPATQEEFDKYFDLRWRILRKNFGQPKGSEKDDTEGSALHLILKEMNQVIACCRIHFNSPIQAQLRYMAVEEKNQHSGAGSRLLKGAEEIAKAKGATEMILEARDTALQFYLKNGYETEKKSHKNFGVQHYTMKKYLI